MVAEAQRKRVKVRYRKCEGVLFLCLFAMIHAVLAMVFWGS